MKGFSTFRRALDAANFSHGRKNLFLRVSDRHDFLCHHLQVGKDTKGYSVNLDIEIGTCYPTPRLYLLGLTMRAPSSLRRDGVGWAHTEPESDYYWSETDDAALASLLESAALPWFRRWEDPQRLIAFLRYVGGERGTFWDREFDRLQVPVRSGAIDWRSLFDLYGNSDLMDEAASCLERLADRYRQPWPEHLQWVTKAQADLSSAKFQRPNTRELVEKLVAPKKSHE